MGEQKCPTRKEENVLKFRNVYGHLITVYDVFQVLLSIETSVDLDTLFRFIISKHPSSEADQVLHHEL